MGGWKSHDFSFIHSFRFVERRDGENLFGSVMCAALLTRGPEADRSRCQAIQTIPIPRQDVGQAASDRYSDLPGDAWLHSRGTRLRDSVGFSPTSPVTGAAGMWRGSLALKRGPQPSRMEGRDGCDDWGSCLLAGLTLFAVAHRLDRAGELLGGLLGRFGRRRDRGTDCGDGRLLDRRRAQRTQVVRRLQP